MSPLIVGFDSMIVWYDYTELHTRMIYIILNIRLEEISSIRKTDPLVLKGLCRFVTLKNAPGQSIEQYPQCLMFECSSCTRVPVRGKQDVQSKLHIMTDLSA